MRIHIKPKYQPQQDFSLEEINQKLANGELDGDELAWIVGMANWISLKEINGVILPSPPSLPDVSNKNPSPLNHPLPPAAPIPPPPLAIFSKENCLKSGPNGVGGWLILFCILIVFIGPLLTLGHRASAWEKLQPAFELYPCLKTATIVDNCGTAAILLYGFIIGIMIWNGNKSGPRLARSYLVLRLVGIITFKFIALRLMNNIPPDSFTVALGTTIGECIPEVLFFLIWWLYFKKSKRVRNTYAK